MQIYHVCNDYSLEELTQEEFNNFSETKKSLKAGDGRVNHGKAIMYRNRHNELVYVEVHHFEDLNGYQL